MIDLLLSKHYAAKNSKMNIVMIWFIEKCNGIRISATVWRFREKIEKLRVALNTICLIQVAVVMI